MKQPLGCRRARRCQERNLNAKAYRPRPAPRSSKKIIQLYIIFYLLYTHSLLRDFLSKLRTALACLEARDFRAQQWSYPVAFTIPEAPPAALQNHFPQGLKRALKDRIYAVFRLHTFGHVQLPLHSRCTSLLELSLIPDGELGNCQLFMSTVNNCILHILRNKCCYAINKDCASRFLHTFISCNFAFRLFNVLHACSRKELRALNNPKRLVY